MPNLLVFSFLAVIMNSENYQHYDMGYCHLCCGNSLLSHSSGFFCILEKIVTDFSYELIILLKVSLGLKYHIVNYSLRCSIAFCIRLISYQHNYHGAVILKTLTIKYSYIQSLYKYIYILTIMSIQHKLFYNIIHEASSMNEMNCQ